MSLVEKCLRDSGIASAMFMMMLLSAAPREQKSFCQWIGKAEVFTGEMWMNKLPFRLALASCGVAEALANSWARHRRILQ